MNKQILDVFIKDISKHAKETVRLRGWVYNFRSSGSIVFLQIRDGSGFIQAVVVKADVPADVFGNAQKINQEASVEVTGTARPEPRAPGGFEISVTDLVIISLSKDDYPIAKKDHGPDFLLSHRHLWLRSRRQWAILRIRNRIITAVNEYLQNNDFIRIDSPIITPSACEGTTTLFDIDYFGEKAYLSQSGQLYQEAAIYSLGRTYDFGPALRAEKSKTRRHLVEFWMMDAEAAFMDLWQMLEFEEGLMQYVIDEVLSKCAYELTLIGRDIEPLKKIKLPYPRMTYDETVKKLHELGSDIVYGSDLGNDDETILMNHFDQPVFITKYPAKVKAFYVKHDKEKPELGLCADLLAPEGYGEIFGGGQREDDYDALMKIVKEHKYSMEDYGWYMDLRKYGSVPHSGFGLGLERIVAWLCKLEHVRESIPFPRMLERFRP